MSKATWSSCKSKTPKYLPRAQSSFNESILKGLDEKYQMFEITRKWMNIKGKPLQIHWDTWFSLILGMPGTGKTTTLSFIIRWIVPDHGKERPDILTYPFSNRSHCLKATRKEFTILRIGHEDKIDKGINPDFLLDKKQFKKCFRSWALLFKCSCYNCTSFGMNHSIFMRKRFDFCIVDRHPNWPCRLVLDPWDLHNLSF